MVSVERWPCKKCITHYETVKSKEFGGGTPTLPEVWSLVFRPRWWGPIHSRSCSEGPGKSRNLTKKFDELNWNLSIPMNELKKGLSRLRLCAVKVEMEKCGAHLAQLPFQTSSGTRHLAFWQDFVAEKTLKKPEPRMISPGLRCLKLKVYFSDLLKLLLFAYTTMQLGGSELHCHELGETWWNPWNPYQPTNNNHQQPSQWPFQDPI